MSSRQLEATARAVEFVRRGGGITAAAIKYGLDRRTVMRACRIAGIPPMAKTGRPRRK